MGQADADVSFEPLYWNNNYQLVMWENPLQLHKRLHLQQGVFLCPGNVELSFMENRGNQIHSVLSGLLFDGVAYHQRHVCLNLSL